jgi:large subunit ribosomal protein L6
LSTRVNSIVQIENWLRSVDKLCRGKLILKGLGYKANLLLNKSRLNLKLGYSHPIGLNIPTDRIRLKVIKNVITVKGHNLAEIGDFARKIRRFRAPDAYKGKGVWQKNEHKILKELRKK